MVPTLSVDGLSEAELRLYAVAENHLGELAEWDCQVLGQELRAIHNLGSVTLIWWRGHLSTSRRLQIAASRA